MIKAAIFSILYSLILLACASTTEKLQGADFYFAEGQKALAKNRCIEATEHFQRLVNNFPGSQLVTEGQYLLAESFFCGDDFVNAAFEYQRLIDIYPGSKWAEEAQFKIGESNYKQIRDPELDQKETYDTLTAFRNFIQDNPMSSRVDIARSRVAECRENLAEKLYQAAYLYQRQGYAEAASLSYDDVLRDYVDTSWYYHALFRLGEIARDKDDVDLAITYWKEVLEDSEDDKLRLNVQEALSKLSVSTG